MKKTLWTISILIALLCFVYMIGPRCEKAVLSTSFPIVPSTIPELIDSISLAESSYGDSIKSGCHSQIRLYNDTTSTEYVLLYLHGYTATINEGMPVASHYASRYGMNMYLPRLDDHAFVTDEPLLNMTAYGLWESAKNALAVAERLGDKVIIMSTSTGGTLALTLAATYPEKIHALINISPNILPATLGVKLLNGPWGLEIARLVQGGKRMKVDSTNYYPEYWSEGPRLESAVELQNLVETTMNEDIFRKITAPSLTLAYYKDEENQDHTVRVDKIREMHSQLSSTVKCYTELPTVGVHPMACGVVSHDIDAVEEAIYDFTENTLNINKTGD
ncbi:MAG: alpha/beta fold hydrolase [Flavobacteriales bacterium]|nr:alpha/beta fold hydrolase [Flavobacteriales bacterium]